MNNYVRPLQLQCNTCGTPGVAPKVTKRETPEGILEEAVWACHRCGTYFKRGTVSLVPKDSEQK